MFFLFSKCAQIVPLTGGKKDMLPPKIIAIQPPNNSTRFNSKKITLTFNEKIQLLNPNDNVFIIPSLSQPLKWNVKNKTLEIILPDTLKSNTTYKVIFHKTIADLTERNILDNFEYVFSTRQFIDSFYIKGNVKDMFTHNNQKSALIALYPEDQNDSVVLKQKPLYFTKTDDNGNYILKNLSNTSYKIFAYTDNNNNFNYDPIKEKIGIVETSVNPAKDSILNFFIAEELSLQNRPKKIFSPTPFQVNIVYTYPDKYHLLNPSPNLFLINDSVPSDTCKILVFNTDTANIVLKNSTQIDTLHIPIYKKKKINLQYTLQNQYNNKQPFFEPIVITSNFWIDSFVVKKFIVFYKNKDSLNPLSINTFQIYPNKIILYYPLEQNTSYTLKIPVKSIHFKDTLFYQKIEIKTNTVENYAQLKIHILFPDKKNYIVALCNTQHKIIYSKYISIPITASNLQMIEFKNIIPDTYYLKLIQDENENKQWDKHQNLLNPLKRHIAEKVFLYPKPIKLINNWDVVLDWKEVK